MPIYRLRSSHEAIADYRKAIELNPNYVLAYEQLGSRLGEQKHYDEALTLLNKGLELAPNFGEMHYEVGIIYLDTDKFDKAVDAFKEAIRLEPQYTLAYKGLAQAYRAQGRLQEAAEVEAQIR